MRLLQRCMGNLRKTDSDKLQIIQNRVLKTVLLAESRYSTSAIYNRLSLDTLEKRRYKQLLHVMYKIPDGMFPEYVLQKFEEHITNYFLRNSVKKFMLCKVKTEVGKRTFSFRGVQCWNRLTYDLKCKLSLSSFKRALDVYLL